MTPPPFTPSGTFVPFGQHDVEQSIVARFEQQVRRHPDRLAVRTAQDTWTYDVLNRRANRIAHAILERDRNGRTPIALLLEQGAPLIAAILAVFKTGKILVGLDPAHPPARLAGFVEEAQPTSMVTSAAHAESARLLTGEPTGVVDVDRLGPELPDANPGVASAADDVAMILYTSGSTGRPKGVLGDHRSWIHNARNYTNMFQVSAEDRLTLLSMGTSQAMKNLLLALLNGASIFPYDVRRHGLTDLIGLMRGESISVTVMGASLFRAFVDALTPSDTFPALRLIRLGSEPVLAHDVRLFRRHFAPPCLLVNGLASGETQTVRFFCVDHRTEVPDGLVPVGYPVEDKSVLLVDDAGHEVEPGHVGEIVVRSPYLAPGYWRRPDLTEAAFRPAATPGDARLYHTGDLGRMDANGCLTCLGRKNSRVKIRGHGVDLLEVEMALRGLDGIKDAVVVARQNYSLYHHLVAYVVPAALPGPTNVSLRETLGRTLPDFMVPSTFVTLGALPRTTAGKIDREALPAPGRPYRDPSRPLTPPGTALEATIADIWCDVMGQDAVDVHEHFYDLGGESLQALRIMARVRKTFGVDLDLQSLLDAPTVAEMAHTVAALGTKTPPEPSPIPGTTVRGAILPLAPVQVPVWRHCQLAGPEAYVLDYAYDLVGPLDIEALTRTLSEIVRRHEILRTAYAVVDGTPVQVVGPAEPAQLIVVDASPSPGRGVAGEAPVPELELAQGRILRAVVTRLGVTEHRLRFSAHHLAMDGRSRDILAAELSALYGAFTRGAASPLPELPIQYGDYAIWHHRRLAPEGETSSRSSRVLVEAAGEATEASRPAIRAQRSDGGETRGGPGEPASRGRAQAVCRGSRADGARHAIHGPRRRFRGPPPPRHGPARRDPGHVRVASRVARARLADRPVREPHRPPDRRRPGPDVPGAPRRDPGGDPGGVRARRPPLRDGEGRDRARERGSDDRHHRGPRPAAHLADPARPRRDRGAIAAAAISMGPHDLPRGGGRPHRGVRSQPLRAGGDSLAAHRARERARASVGRSGPAGRGPGARDGLAVREAAVTGVRTGKAGRRRSLRRPQQPSNRQLCHLICFAQKRTASAIHPWALVPTPRPKP